MNFSMKKVLNAGLEVLRELRLACQVNEHSVFNFVV